MKVNINLVPFYIVRASGQHATLEKAFLVPSGAHIKHSCIALCKVNMMFAGSLSLFKSLNSDFILKRH